MNKNDNDDKITEEKKIFYDMVYTPLSSAIKILEERQKDKNLIEKIDRILKNNIPEPLQKISKNGVLFRQVATPNFEARWFIELTKDHGLKTNFFEYFDDKFTSNNYYKHSLGQLIIHNDKKNKKGEDIEERITIVNFNKYNGKELKDVKTLWGDSLIDFHKKLFEKYSYKKEDFNFYDASEWFMENGDEAINYYTNFILLFICRGILFENFLFSGSEEKFTKDILLPAFKKALELAEVKPLIVPIPPMDGEIEEDMHWHSYSPKIKALINLK
ncbi:MAG: hypothetical protein WC241_02930 [Candidatus Paceibacterota bacterium]|jgi:hypothetical protein